MFYHTSDTPARPMYETAKIHKIIELPKKVFFSGDRVCCVSTSANASPRSYWETRHAASQQTGREQQQFVKIAQFADPKTAVKQVFSST